MNLVRSVKQKINHYCMDNDLLKIKYIELKQSYLELKHINQNLEKQIQVFKMYYDMDADKIKKQKKEINRLQETVMSLLFD